MNIRARWEFYKSIFPFVIAFGIICIIAVGVFWGFALFSTLGLLFGFVAFQNFRKDEYYFYYNLGLTKWKLFKSSFLINVLVGLPIFAILLLIIFFFFGRLTLT